MTGLDLWVATKIRADQDGCWRWTGCLSPKGYGWAWIGPPFRHFRVAHRVIFELLIGSVPTGLQLDHLCRVRSCVNPTHLEPVTRKINILRGVGITAINAERTACRNGHSFTPDNIYLHDGKRHCRACRRIKDKARRARFPVTAKSSAGRFLEKHLAGVRQAAGA